MKQHRSAKLGFAPVIYLVALLSLGITPAAWAGAAEEVAAIGQQRTPAFEKGDADAYVAAFADNAVYTSSLQLFRIEGKGAIKDFFTTLFETYPTRHIAGRGGTTRVYANDSVVVSDGYAVITFTDKSGKTSDIYTRTSLTWVKMGIEWKIVDQHVSQFRPTP
jgi:uncharacterized protein (TIGR02246 family)